MSSQAKGPADESAPGPAFTVTNQKVFLDLDLRSRKLKGKTEITINPSSSDLKAVRLSCRQLTILQIQLGRKSCPWKYIDPYERLKLPYQGNVHHHHKLRERLASQRKYPPEPELEVTLPKSHKINESYEAPVLVNGTSLNAVGASNAESTPRFEPFILSITFEIIKVKDGLQFVGWNAEDLRYPHAYTWSSPHSTIASLFPCLDSLDCKCTWEISIKTPRSLADALSKSHGSNDNSVRQTNGGNRDSSTSKSLSALSNEDHALDLTVVCSGDMTDEIVDAMDPARKTTSFLCSTPVSVRHIGFAIGPFEEVNLAAFRDSDEDEKLGRNAIPIHGFCLPGRSKDLRNTCFPIAKAIDYFVMEFGSYPFPSYKLCFLDDMYADHYDTATLSICSTRLLFPENVIDPINAVTRELVVGLASQWAGVSITPKEPTDLWAVLGMSYFITDLFLRKLSGNNEYRFSQKQRADRVCSLDVGQPSIYDCGQLACLDPSHHTLIAAKAPLVLFILDRRLAKTGGSTGFSRIVSKIFLQTNVGEIVEGSLSTAHFIRVCERLGHTKLEGFFNQWVYGCGCPRFRVTQRFNKKRLVIEMQISQAQHEDALQDLEASKFMRAVKEREHDVSIASPLQIFTGPMTIRIHEADGTPYEHIVEIKESTTRFDIPYNTKYKRLKRNRRHRERAFLGGTHDAQMDGQEDVLLYCLGDVLQSEEEMRDWRLAEWSKEDEERMNGESYEWIRMDADFEWICQMTINMPGYMFVSQLQQDRDVVAQYETIQYLASQKAHPLVSTILLRTLMDSRYFHGIRTMAAAGLSNHAREEVDWLGWFHLEKAFHDLFCLEASLMTRSNDFSDRASYFVQCAIPYAVSSIRDSRGRAPFPVRRFLFEKLRFNDNSNNEFSDCFYLAILMKGLADATASAPLLDTEDLDMDDGGDDYLFFKSCSDEIDRYRRLDEWIPSYQNILSVTALLCTAKLAKAGVVDKNPAQYLLFTREGGFEEIRVAAFESLVELGFGRNDHIIRWFLHTLGHDPSPLIRMKLLKLFRDLIGSIAIGEEASIATANDSNQQSDGLIIEQESTTEARKAHIARKQTVQGAVDGLKAEIATNGALKAGLWDAISSPNATVSEVLELLTVCSLLYESEQRIIFTIRYPRYWTIASLDRVPATPDTAKPKLILKFKQNGRFRQKPKPALAVQPAPTAIKPPTIQKRSSMNGTGAAASKPLLHLTHKAAKSSQPMASAGINGTLNKAPPVEAEKPKLKLFFKAPRPPTGGPGTGDGGS